MDVVVVWSFSRGWIGGEVGVAGWVRSKPSLSLKSQKFEVLPTTRDWALEDVILDRATAGRIDVLYKSICCDSLVCGVQ